MNQPERDLVAYRLTRARETLTDAQLLLDQHRLPAAANRIYYAMFYAATALLLTKGLSSSRHSGVIGLFRREFVRTGLFPSELAQHLDEAFAERLESDYGDYVQFEPADIEDLLAAARRFVDKAEEVVRNLSQA
ncbi:HEPN domain-containing protein [candidate division WOR-3 bacterium]|nr:HEPN domain-containing protein [candidate division WOR-3 bacterium]